MTLLIGPLLNTFLSLFVGACIRNYPLWDKRRVSLKILAGIYALVFLIECVIFISFQEYFAADYLGNQIFKALTGALLILIPLFATRGSVFQNLFLISVVTHYVIVIFGVGNFVELTYGGAFARNYPYFICDGVVILLSAALLPLTLKALGRLFNLLPGRKALVWKYIWIIPTLFAVLCLMTANVFMGENAVSTAFVIGRIFIGAGMIVTCFLLARTLRQEADNAAIAERARMTEQQLVLQREQYDAITKNAEDAKRSRHDLHHQLAVIKSYGNAGDAGKLNAYLDELAASISTDNEKTLCENFAVNAVALHYLAITESEGIDTYVRLDVPTKTGQVLDSDLCVIVGNFLENAIEACRRMEHGERFIKLNSVIKNDRLVITMDNSFNGEIAEKDGVFRSSKRDDDGVGLSSVRAIARKYGGSARFESNGGIFLSSVNVNMGEQEMAAE